MATLSGNWWSFQECPHLHAEAFLRRLRCRVESWLTAQLMQWFGRRGYTVHVGTCRDWVDLEDAARVAK